MTIPLQNLYFIPFEPFRVGLNTKGTNLKAEACMDFPVRDVGVSMKSANQQQLFKHFSTQALKALYTTWLVQPSTFF